MSESTLQHHNDDGASHEGTEVILPTGWTYGYDESYAQYYYVHTDSGHSQWEYPTHEDDFHCTDVPTDGHEETSPAEGDGKNDAGEEKTTKSHVDSDYKYDWGSKDEAKGESKADYDASSLRIVDDNFKVDRSRTSVNHRLNPISSSHYSMQGYEEEHVDTTYPSTAGATATAVQKAIPRSQSSSSISKSISLSEYGYHGPTDGIDPEILAAYASSKQSPLMRAAQRRGYNVGSSFRVEAFSPNRHHASNKFQWESTSPSFEDQSYSPAESYSYGLPSRHSSEKYQHHQEAVEVEWYGSEDGDNGDDEDAIVSTEAMEEPPEHSTAEGEQAETMEHANSSFASSKKTKVSMLRGGTNQDYENMARLYRLQRPYADPHYDAACVLCYQNFAEDVFFPCEHHCVCRKCIYTEKICEERMLHKLPDGYINCSLCAAIIKRILPLNGGREVDDYWAWVLEERPVLPREFLRNFKHSAGVIEAVYVSDAYKRAHGLPVDGDGKSCHVS